MTNLMQDNPDSVTKAKASRSREQNVRLWTNIGLLNAIVIGLIVIFCHGGIVTTAIAWGGASLACGGLLGFLFGIPGRSQGGVQINQPGIATVDTTIGHAAGRGGVPAQEDAHAATPTVTVSAAPDHPADPRPKVSPANTLAAAPKTQVVPQPHSDGSNLEQVSDWVTKLLLGGGLTQMQQIPGMVWKLASIVAVGVANNPGSTLKPDPGPEQAFAAGMLIYFFITGFFGGYLITKLELGRRIL